MFETFRLKRALKGSLVMCFDCRGCMASDQRMKWIGEVTGFEMTRYAGEAAQVKVIKRDGPGDIRDGDQGFEIVVLGEVQEIAPGLYGVFR
ncbi:MAG: hypothetical protein EOR84_22790 [Mesorhizobium sp.]|uniref:hypothetical protein n=1 Tax=Mesorhizobium sp. TaxID=1871066 RepID=UPI000FE82E2D|nr:hypothetical protein [Mesorhizobium sp.]RWM90039.1 MAG: hypothetical protein EOR84_22790 [Mesorhizobium sp.]